MKPRGPIIISDGWREVRIYTTKNRGRILYQLSHNFGGTRERRSFSDQQEAKREASILLNTHTREEAAGMCMSLADIQSYGAAKRILDEAKIPLHVAAEMVAQAKRELGESTSIVEAARYWARNNSGITRKSVSDLIEEYIEDRKAAQTDEAYQSNIRRVLTLFAAVTKGVMLPDIRTEQIDNWLHGLAWEPITKKNARQRLVTFSRWAKKRGYLGMENRAFEAARCFRIVQKDTEIFTPDEMRRLLEAAATNPILPLMAIGGFSGMRYTEITRLDWSEVLWDRSLIEVKGYKSKTRARRLVPLLDNLRAWIEPFSCESGPVLLHNNPAAALGKVAARAGVKWKKNALRHSFCSYRLSATNDGAKTALESGHAQNILFRYYHALVSAETARNWFNLYPSDHTIFC
jgi:integrase